MFRHIMPVWLAVLLAACGGGGGSDSPAQQAGTTADTGNDGTSDNAVVPDSTGSQSGAGTSHAVGGEVTGLATSSDADGTGLTLVLSWQQTGGSAPRQEVIRLTDDGPFRFSQALPGNTAYTLQVGGFPADRLCRIRDGVGEGAAEVQLRVSPGADNATFIDCDSWESAISGTVYAPWFFVRDSDVNDPEADYADNSTFTRAQSFITGDDPVHIQGYVSAEPSGNTTAGDRFAREADTADFFATSLKEGAILSVNVAAHDSGADLDLYLYRRTDGKPELSMVTMQDDSIEAVSVPADDEYFIEVRAVAGASAYALRITDSVQGDPVSGWSADFEPGEILLSTQGDSPLGVARTAGIHPASTRALDRRTTALLQVDTARHPAPDVSESTRTRLATLNTIKRLQQQAGVAHVEPNFRVRPQRVSNDPFLEEQDHYLDIDLPGAWDISTGAARDGTDNVVVAVVDSGVLLSHPELSGRLLPGYDFISDADSSNDGDGIDADPDDPGTPGEGSWHGTHVAGTIAANSNNGSGVAGISWYADIMPLRATTADYGTVYDILQAVLYAAGMDNDSGRLPERTADIINLSVGGADYSAVADEIFRRVTERGILVVASAGNSATRSPQFPAGYDSVLAVGASNRDGQKTDYSSFGAYLDLLAPGNRVLSLSVNDSSGSREPAMRKMTGTSMSAAQVSGVLALMKAVYPALDTKTMRRLLVAGRMTSDVGTPGFDVQTGFGQLDAFTAVRAARDLAAGAAMPQTPASFLVPEYERLDLDEASQERICVHDKLGNSQPVTSVTDDSPWLYVRQSPRAGPGAYCLDIQVDRSILQKKRYQGRIVVKHGSPTADLALLVNIEVSREAVRGDLGKVSVILSNAGLSGHPPVGYQSPGSVGHPPVGYQSPSLQYLSGGEAHFEFRQLYHGRYHVIAGSDVDNDGVTCHVGEICGVWRLDDDGSYLNLPLEEAELGATRLVDADGSDGTAGKQLRIDTVLLSAPLDHPFLPANGIKLPVP